MLYDSSCNRRRDALIIICDLYIHRSKCKDILLKYFDFVIEKDPLLLYDYIMEFTWLYAYNYSLKKNLYLKIVMYHHQRWWLDVNRSKRLSQVFFYSSGNKPRF